MRRSHATDRTERFSDLLGILSTRFARISPEEIDAEINGWLERVCHSLDLDRSVIAEYLPEKGGFYTICQWNREGFPPAPGPMAAASDFLPWVSGKGTIGEIVIVPEVSALPAEAARDRDFMLGAGPKAILAVPLIIETRLVAGVTFEDFHGPRRWTPSLVARLKLVSDIFANALERKRSTIEANTVRNQAESVGRLALMGEMAAAMAHELSYPLSVILANAQAARRLLESAHPNLSELKETLDDVITGERRAAAYVAKVRALFRGSELHTESLQVDGVLNAVASLTRGDLSARNTALQIHIEAGLPMVAADRVGIEQVMINLIHNATDAACENNGCARQVTVRAFRRDPRWIAIAVSDTETGIDSKDVGNIFRPLFTTKANGTGLGLTIVRSIVESHGAEIHVRSEPGAGATFEFTVPVAGEN
jgi:signal transduction histidine kinase